MIYVSFSCCLKLCYDVNIIRVKLRILFIKIHLEENPRELLQSLKEYIN